MKLSPLTVPYRVVQRGGSVLAAIGFAAFSGGGAIPLGPIGPLLVVGLASLALALVVAYEVAYYRNYEYELTADTLDIRSGVFATRTREIPLRRIQNVDVSRDVLQRALGIAAVDFETAGGSETEAAIRFVSVEEARRLRRELTRLKAGADAGEAEEPTQEELFALNDRELALLGAFSFDFRVPGALFVLLSSLGPLVSGALPPGLDSPALLGGAAVLFVAVVVVSWAVGATVAAVNYYGFRLGRVGDELYYERGLLQRYDGSIPLDKVQTLTIEDNPLKRRFGYATLVIETAGYAPGGSDRGTQAAVPLARRERVIALASDIESFGEPDFERPPRRVRRRYAARYLLALGAVTVALAAVNYALVGVPWYATAALVPLVPVAAHYKWLHRGHWLGEDHFVTRNGVLTRQTKVVPYYRVQTVLETRTVFQRRWNLATVTADTAGSLSLTGADASAVDVDEETAGTLRTELASRLREALADRRRGTSGLGSRVRSSVPEVPPDAEGSGGGIGRSGGAETGEHPRENEDDSHSGDGHNGDDGHSGDGRGDVRDEGRSG